MSSVDERTRVAAPEEPDPRGRRWWAIASLLTALALIVAAVVVARWPRNPPLAADDAHVTAELYVMDPAAANDFFRREGLNLHAQTELGPVTVGHVRWVGDDRARGARYVLALGDAYNRAGRIDGYSPGAGLSDQDLGLGTASSRDDALRSTPTLRGDASVRLPDGSWTLYGEQLDVRADVSGEVWFVGFVVAAPQDPPSLEDRGPAAGPEPTLGLLLESSEKVWWGRCCLARGERVDGTLRPAS
ncbi:MAG TPA: hypothetical protein VFS29_03905 [Motilibacteraceae bacterium]|nr:hypothetical protein [Motilibacteraceae bacterium]